MYIEKRKNGTFYLKHSVYNPETKLPKNTSVYLGSNPIQAKQKLKSITDAPDLLEQIPDTELYEIELKAAIKELQKLNSFRTRKLKQIMTEYLTELTSAEQFIIGARTEMIVPVADCLSCRFNQGNCCRHFNQIFSVIHHGPSNKSFARCCMAYEEGEKNPRRQSIKLPRDFRS